MIYVLLAAVIALTVAYILTPLVKNLAARWGVIAHPGGRRTHRRPTPLMGGLAMYAGFTIAVAIAVALDPNLHFGNQLYGILAGGTFLAIIGVLDDKYELPGWLQAGCIVISGLILALFGVKIQYITNPFRGGHLMWLGLFSIPVTMLWVLMVTKAVDCMTAWMVSRQAYRPLQPERSC